MRMILIDPFARTVTEQDIQPGLANLYAALSGPGFPTDETFPLDPAEWGGLDRETRTVRTIDIISLGGGQDLIIDDEGRLADAQACFRFVGPAGPSDCIAGRALIASHDAEGDTVGTILPLKFAAARVEFLPWDFDYTPPPPVVIVGEEAIRRFYMGGR